MARGAGRGQDEMQVVLEFFGIKMTTSNERLAQFLRTDVTELLHCHSESVSGEHSCESITPAGAHGTESDE